MTKPPSFIAVPRIPYVPLNDSVQRLHPDRFDLYMGHRCWPLQLELSLASWDAIKRSSFHSQLRPTFETMYSHIWTNSVSAFSVSRDQGQSMFQYCTDTYGKPFHDPSCPPFKALVALLSIADGPKEKREKFKTPIYVVLAFILCFAKYQHNKDWVSPDLLQKALVENLSSAHNRFLWEVVFPFVDRNYFPQAPRDADLFQMYLKENPSRKNGM